jgi:hypothetical protein
MSNIRLADPSRTVEPTHRRRYQLGDGLAGLMGFEAATLAAAAFLHLHGNIQGRSRSFDPDMAGIAEAVIGCRPGGRSCRGLARAIRQNDARASFRPITGAAPVRCSWFRFIRSRRV